MSRSVLLVDDSAYLRMTIKRILTDSGFTVSEASNGEEALRRIGEKQFDIILLDLLLPRVGGEQVLRALHEAPATAAIPVVVLSSLPQCNAEKLKEAGAVAYIQKSKLDLNSGGHDLVRLLDAALRRKTPRVEAETAH